MTVRRSARFLILTSLLSWSVAVEVQARAPCVEYLTAMKDYAVLRQTAIPFAGKPPRSLRKEIKHARKRIMDARVNAAEAIKDPMARWVLGKAEVPFQATLTLGSAIGDWESQVGRNALEALEMSTFKLADAARPVFDEALKAACRLSGSTLDTTPEQPSASPLMRSLER